MTEPVPGGVYLMPDEVATVLAALGDAQYWRDPVPGSCPDCISLPPGIPAAPGLCADHQADADLTAAYRRLKTKLGGDREQLEAAIRRIATCGLPLRCVLSAEQIGAIMAAVDDYVATGLPAAAKGGA